jgi:hypothetical protein
MFRTKRTYCVALALLLSALLLPLPAMAGSLGEPASTALRWDGLWADLLAWLGLDTQSPSTESCAMVDPNGCPKPNAPSWETAEDSSYIDPNGQSSSIDSCAMVDPLGCPGGSH